MAMKEIYLRRDLVLNSANCAELRTMELPFEFHHVNKMKDLKGNKA